MQWSHCNDSSVGPPPPSSPTLTEAPKGIQFSFLVSASHPLTWFPLPSLCWSPMTVSPTQTHFSMSWAIVLRHRRKADNYTVIFILVMSEEQTSSKPLTHVVLHHCKIVSLSFYLGVTFVWKFPALLCDVQALPALTYCSFFQFAFAPLFNLLSCRGRLLLW